MLDFLLYLAFSVFETFSLFFLAFKLFKIDLYPKEMVFSSLILGFISYELRINYGWLQIDLMVQFILVVCFMWLLFRIHPFYALIMTGMTYQAYSFTQTLYFYLLNHIPLFSLDFNFITPLSLYLLQILSATSVIIIGNYIGNARLGFDFVPDKPTDKVHISSRDKILFALTLPSLLILLSTIYFSDHLTEVYIILPLTYALILYSFLYLSYKKDRGSHGNIGI